MLRWLDTARRINGDVLLDVVVRTACVKKKKQNVLFLSLENLLCVNINE